MILEIPALHSPNDYTEMGDPNSMGNADGMIPDMSILPPVPPGWTEAEWYMKHNFPVHDETNPNPVFRGY